MRITGFGLWGAALLPLCLFGASPALAQDGQGMSLERLHALALAERPELSLADARVREAEAGLLAEEAKSRPTIGFQADVALRPGGELVEIDGPGGRRLLVSGSPSLKEGAKALSANLGYGVGVAASWQIADFGQSAAREAVARAAVQVEAAGAAKSREALLQTVNEAYLAWLEAFELHKMIQGAVQGGEAMLAAVEARIQSGALPQTALVTAQADLAAIRLKAAYAEEAEMKSRAALSLICRSDLPEGAFPLKIVLDRPASEADEPDLELARLEAELRWAEAGREAVERLHRPVLKAELQLGLRGQSADLFPVYQLGLGLRFPFWDGGQQSAQAAQAAARVEAMQARLAIHQMKVKQSERLSQGDEARAQKRLELAQNLLAHQSERLKAAEAGFSEGILSQEALGRVQEAKRSAQAELLQVELQAMRLKLAGRSHAAH